MVWQGCFGKWLAPFSLFYAEEIQKGEKNTEKVGKRRKRTEKHRKNAEKAQGKCKENATEMPILDFWSGRPKGARGISAASKGKRGLEVPRCGGSGNKKRGLERDSEGISGIGGFGAFAIVKGAFVRWTRRLGRGGNRARAGERNKRQQATGRTARAGARRHAEAA